MATLQDVICMISVQAFQHSMSYRVFKHIMQFKEEKNQHVCYCKFNPTKLLACYLKLWFNTCNLSKW